MDKLGEDGHFTLFAPTDEAFDNLPPGYFESIIENNPVITGTDTTRLQFKDPLQAFSVFFFIMIMLLLAVIICLLLITETSLFTSSPTR